MKATRHCKSCGVKLSREWHDMEEVIEGMDEVCDACMLASFERMSQLRRDRVASWHDMVEVI